MRRASCYVQGTTGIRVTDVRAPLRWLCLGRWRNTRACRASTRRRAGCVRPCAMKGHCTGGRPFSFDARPWCDLLAVTSSSAAGIRATDALAPLRWLSLGRWRNTGACRARAPRRTRCDRTAHHEMALHRRKASLISCKTVVRCATCGFQHAAGFYVARAHAPLRWLSLGRWQNTRACRVHAPPRAGYELFTHHGRVLDRRKVSLLRHKTVVRRASYDLQQRKAGFRVTDA